MSVKMEESEPKTLDVNLDNAYKGEAVGLRDQDHLLHYGFNKRDRHEQNLFGKKRFKKIFFYKI